MKPDHNDIASTASVVVVGAGLSGLTAARRLSESQIDVQILEKSRGIGGRCATRRIQDVSFDHGAQFFTVRDAEFQCIADQWLESNRARVWSYGFPRTDRTKGNDGHPRFCAVNGMNSLPKSLAQGLTIRKSTQVAAARRTEDYWLLEIEDGHTVQSESLVLTAPIPQSLELLPTNINDDLTRTNPELSQVEYESCFALMVLLDGPSNIPLPGALQVKGDTITWIADNTQKLRRTGRSSLTIHTSPTFTRDNFDMPHSEIASAVLEIAKPWLGSNIVEWEIHRWRYSKPTTFAGVSCVTWGQPVNLILCGDCMLPPSRMEGAILSGLAAADTLLENKDKLA